MRADSCAIFRIGHCQGIRMLFDVSVCWVRIPTLPAMCSMVMETVRDDEGQPLEQRPCGVPRMGVYAHWYPLASCRPGERTRRGQFVQWTFTPVFDAPSPAVAGIIERARVVKSMSPFQSG